ncbi:hypothetical protein PG990_011397 [Apiospora arundinis]
MKAKDPSIPVTKVLCSHPLGWVLITAPVLVAGNPMYWRDEKRHGPELALGSVDSGFRGSSLSAAGITGQGDGLSVLRELQLHAGEWLQSDPDEAKDVVVKLDFSNCLDRVQTKMPDLCPTILSPWHRHECKDIRGSMST